MPLKSGYSAKTVDENVRNMMRKGFSKEQSARVSLDAARTSYFKAHPKGHLPAALALPGGRRDRAAWDAGRKKNPVPASKRVQVRDAAKLYENFSGHDAETVAVIDKPEMPDVVLVIGELDFVGYTTVRDNQTEKYIHEFKKNCRPLLCSTSDGKTLVLIGGQYTFTERGIVDAR